MRKIILSIAILLCAVSIYAQTNAADSTFFNRELEELTVSSTRFKPSQSLTQQSVSSHELQEQNTGVNLPYLLTSTPSLVVTSDDGLGIGYTYFRVRGTDHSRINMTVNGVPLNDSESQSVFWVNMSDMASSMNSVDVQRGVGTSTNGSSSFGASVNMQTDKAALKPYASVTFNGGMYNTFRESVKVGTGIMDNGFAFDARYSKVNSDGYLERAFTDAYSYSASAAWYGNSTMLKLMTYGGAQSTYMAWDGVSMESFVKNPRYNPAGAMENLDGSPMLNADGSQMYYENQTDNYEQQHYQLHASHVFTPSLNLNAALHYTHGFGYYEQYKNGEDYADYGLSPVTDDNGALVDCSNLIRKKFMDNDFYGGVLSLNYIDDNLKATFGGAMNNYVGAHFGDAELLVPDLGSVYAKDYYHNVGEKLDGNVYAKANYTVMEGLSLYGDLQYRYINYVVNGMNDDTMSEMNVNETFHFFNPKAGVSYVNENHSAYATFAIANREPSRSNFTDAGPNERPMAERLYDYELGYNYAHRIFNLGANLYFMDYKNQLVLTGKLSDTGAALTTNVKDSYRAGIELVGGVKIAECLRWDANVTLSRNKILNYTDWVDDWYADWNSPEVVAKNGQEKIEYGDMDIAFSPSITAGSKFDFTMNGFNAALQTNYVGKQYLSNTMSDDAKIDAYAVTNLHLAYTVPVNKAVKDITFNVQMNNLFNSSYVSNGWSYSYFEGADANGNFSAANQKYMTAYYAQARFNIHAGFVVNF